MEKLLHYELSPQERLEISEAARNGAHFDRPEMLCRTGDGHAVGTRLRSAVTCPACIMRGLSENYTVIIRAIHEREALQTAALAELARRGLWLTPEQKQQAGLIPGHPDTAQRDCEVQQQEERNAERL